MVTLSYRAGPAAGPAAIAGAPQAGGTATSRPGVPPRPQLVRSPEAFPGDGEGLF